VAYLVIERFKHRSLICSTILLNTNGDIKINKEPF